MQGSSEDCRLIFVWYSCTCYVKYSILKDPLDWQILILIALGGHTLTQVLQHLRVLLSITITYYWSSGKKERLKRVHSSRLCVQPFFACSLFSEFENSFPETFLTDDQFSVWLLTVKVKSGRSRLKLISSFVRDSGVVGPRLHFTHTLGFFSDSVSSSKLYSNSAELFCIWKGQLEKSNVKLCSVEHCRTILYIKRYSIERRSVTSFIV